MEDDHAYEDMKEFDWCDLSEAVEQNKRDIFWTTQNLCELENGLREKRLAFVPRYTGPDLACRRQTQTWHRD